jgi:hypothetical protein
MVEPRWRCGVAEAQLTIVCYVLQLDNYIVSGEHSGLRFNPLAVAFSEGDFTPHNFRGVLIALAHNIGSSLIMNYGCRWKSRNFRSSNHAVFDHFEPPTDLCQFVGQIGFAACR